MGERVSPRKWIPAVVLLFGWLTARAPAQRAMAALTLHVADAQGLALPSQVTVVSEGNQIDETLATDGGGNLSIRRLPYGSYEVSVVHAGFAPATEIVELGTAIPRQLTLTLRPAMATTSITVSAAKTLLDRGAAGQVYRIGKGQIAAADAPLPGRGLAELVDS